MSYKDYIILVIVILLLIIVFQNLGPVQVQIFFWTLNISLMLVILIPFFLGVLTGWLLPKMLSSKKSQSSEQ